MTASPLLLIPGLASDAAVWADMPAGEVMQSNADTIDDMAADILTRAPDRFALAGSSLGGYIALAMVRAAPGRIERLALLSTSARPDDERQKAIRLSMIAAAERDYETLLVAMGSTMMHPDADAALSEGMRAMARRAGVTMFVRQQRAALARPDARPGLAAIAVPTLVLAGEDDQVVPLERATEMAQTIAGARLVTIARCGHIPQRERPKETAAAMHVWLGRKA